MNSSTVIDKINGLNYKGFKEAYVRQLEDVNYNRTLGTVNNSVSIR